MARCSHNSLRVCPLLSCNRSSNSRRLESARALKTSSIASDYATKWLHVKRHGRFTARVPGRSLTQRAAHADAGLVEHVRVNHCRTPVFLANVMSSGVETSLRCFSIVQSIQRTLHADAGLVEHVRVNHRCAHIFVA